MGIWAILAWVLEETANLTSFPVRLVIDAKWMHESGATDLLKTALKKWKDFKLAKVLITTVPFGENSRLPIDAWKCRNRIPNQLVK